jgi:hypothetical protein
LRLTDRAFEKQTANTMFVIKWLRVSETPHGALAQHPLLEPPYNDDPCRILEVRQIAPLFAGLPAENHDRRSIYSAVRVKARNPHAALSASPACISFCGRIRSDI